MPFKYTTLPAGTRATRLLCLHPSKSKSAPIQCDLLEYSLENTNRCHLYEALSYFWGDPTPTNSITVNGAEFRIAANLSTALLHLRDTQLYRILWIDAICINQEDIREKGYQIQLMGLIYSLAQRVFVWLGEDADDSRAAIRYICSIAQEREQGLRAYEGADDRDSDCSGKEEREDDADSFDCDGKESPPRYTLVLAQAESVPRISCDEGLHNQAAVLKLLHRPWFSRIWVLQEIGLARSVVFACGDAEMDGYVFSAGATSSGMSYAHDPDLRAVVSSVASLVKRGIYRLPRTDSVSQRLSLADLVNMYHSRKATVPHDKVYALLGLCDEDLRDTGLLPDYSLSWNELMEKLAHHVLSREVVVETERDGGVAFIKGKGYVFGHVISAKRGSARNESQNIKVERNTIAISMDLNLDFSVPMPARPIRHGDIVCHLQGSSRLCVIREEGDYFAIISSAPGLEALPVRLRDCSGKNLLLWGGLYVRDFSLTWDLNPQDNPLPPPKGNDGSSVRHRSRLQATRQCYRAGLIVADAKTIKNRTMISSDSLQQVLEAIRMHEDVLGQEHHETIVAKEGLAMLYITRFNLEKAEEILFDVLQTRKRMDGPDHPHVLNTLAIFALAYIYYPYLPYLEASKLPSESWEVTDRCCPVIEKIRRNDQIMEEDVLISLDVVETAGLIKLLGLFFHLKDSRKLITENVVRTVAGNVRNGHKVMAYLLDHMGSDLFMSEEVLKLAAANSEHGGAILECIISRRGKDLFVSEELVRLATTNKCNWLSPSDELFLFKSHEIFRGDPPVVQLLDLLEHRGEILPLTEDVMMETARNKRRGHMFMDDFLNRRKDDLVVPDAVIETAVRTWVDYFAVETTHRLISRNWVPSSLPERILVAAAGRPWHSDRLLARLLGWAGRELALTEEVILAAALNERNYHENLQTIGEHGYGIPVSQDLVSRVINGYPAAWFAPRGAVQVMLNCESFVFSEAAVQAVLDYSCMREDRNLISHLFERRETLQISPALVHRIELVKQEQ